LQLARSREARPCGLPEGSRSGGCHAARMFYKKILGAKSRNLLLISFDDNFYKIFYFVIFVVNFFLLGLRW